MALHKSENSNSFFIGDVQVRTQANATIHLVSYIKASLFKTSDLVKQSSGKVAVFDLFWRLHLPFPVT